MHMHVKVDLHFFGKEAFICVSEKNDKLLSRVIVKHILDQQIAEIAK